MRITIAFLVLFAATTAHAQQIESSKLNTYNIDQQTDVRSSKLNGYSVDQQIDIRSSKIIAYVVVQRSIGFIHAAHP